jgi:alanyl-tRNA synthetase
VITEESGIAKGIRRITAVTGHDAQEVTRTAEALKVKLEEAQQLNGKEKDDALKVLAVVRMS